MVKIKNILTKNSKLFGILFIGLSSLSLLLTIMFNFSVISLFGIILELITIGVIAIIIDKKLPTENKQIIKSKIPLFLILIVYASISRVLRGNFLLFLFYLVHSLIIFYCFIEGYKLFNFVPTSKLFMEDLSLLFSKNNSQNINNNVNNQNNQNVYQGQNNYNQPNIQQNMYNNMYQNQMMNNNINGYQNVDYQQGYNQGYQQNIQNQDFNTYNTPIYNQPQNYQQNQQGLPQQPLYQPDTNYQGYQPNQQINQYQQQYQQPQMPNMNQVQSQQNQLYQNVSQQSFDNQSQAYVSHGLSDEEFDEIIEDNNKLEVKPLYEKDLHPHQQPQQNKNKNKNNFTLPKIN